MTIPIFHLLLSFSAGAGIGILFFGGLWWTVRRLETAERPALLTVSSFFVRTGLTVLGLYYIMGGQWERLISALLGIMVIRFLMVRLLSPQREPEWVIGKQKGLGNRQ